MQFKDLQKSYQVYILYKGEKIRHKMGTVVSIANPRFQPLQPGQLSYQQPQDKIVDLEVSVDGVSSTFVVRENMTVEVRNDITISCDRDPIVKKYIDDPDGYDGIAFSRYLADLKRTGKYIDWEEMI